jgi:hypothetical protein
MTHLTDDDLVLYYYGEDDQAAHLAACAPCAARYRDLAAVMDAVPPIEPPPRDGRYAERVWTQVQPRLALRRRWGVSWQRMIAVAAAVVLLIAGFTAGRLWRPTSAPTIATTRGGVDADAAATDVQRRRVLLLTVADHLERSDRVLTEVMNAGNTDLAMEQQWARDLVAANRLYRQEAIDADETSVAVVLDDLERALLDIVHRPAAASPGDIEPVRRRIDAAALVFKVRVMRTELRQRTPSSIG